MEQKIRTYVSLISSNVKFTFPQTFAGNFNATVMKFYIFVINAPSIEYT